MSTAILFLWTGCSKDKYTTKPQLDFKKVNAYHVKQRDNLNFDLDVTDKEGDIQNLLYIQTIVKNFPALTKTDSFPIAPTLPTTKDLKAIIKICYSINVFDGGCPLYSARSSQNKDTTTFRFWIKDKDNNVSDTTSADKPIVIEN